MSTGLSTDRLQRIDRHLTENYIDAGRIPGALTLVARRGEVAHFSPLGLMDAEREKPTQLDTIYRIYSMTKPITSVALMTLYEEGRFQLSDPVSEYLPEWSNTEVWVGGEYPDFETRPAERAITIRDLLSHQSGLTYGFLPDHPVDAAYAEMLAPSNSDSQISMLRIGDIEGSLVDWSARIAELPLRFSPGDNWNYSVATDICGRLVEALSGDRFDLFLRGRILEPLGMVDTGFYVPEGDLDRFAACYVPGEHGGISLQDDPATSDYRKPPSFLSGGGGMVGTATDYFRFSQMLLNGGELDGERILGRKTIELMTVNHLPGGASIAERAQAGMWSEPALDGIGFGLGFSVGLGPSRSQLPRSPGQFAWGGAASTAFWVDPAEDLVFVFMTQLLQNPHPLREELQVLVNAAIED